VDLGQQQEPQSQPQTTAPGEDLGLSNQFLSNIPAADRAVVGRYIKDWDAGVTKKFQSYADRIKKYEALGPEDQLTQYVNFANNFRANPEAVFRLMWEGLQEQYGEGFEQELLRILAVEQEMNEYNPFDEQQDYEQQEYDPNEVFQQNVVSELEELRSWREQQEAAAAEAEEFEQLDQVLGAMHQRFGDFDDDFILLRLGNHGDINRAMQEWNQMVQKYGGGGSPQRQAPKVMGGQGGVPTDNVDITKLRGKERRAVIANMLAASDQ